MNPTELIIAGTAVCTAVPSFLWALGRLRKRLAARCRLRIAFVYDSREDPAGTDVR